MRLLFLFVYEFPVPRRCDSRASERPVSQEITNLGNSYRIRMIA